jgi:hypothetical protein
MSEGAARFAARFPVVWHVIEADGAGSWLPSTGLLPTTTLLRMAGVAASDANRDDFRLISLGKERVAVLRPQLMADQRLTPTLAGRFVGQPGAWRHHINAHVFFWTEPRRRDAFVRASLRLRSRSVAAPGTAPPLILTIDTAALLRHHANTAFVARINTGSTVRGGARARRDESTFEPIACYRTGTIAELAIRGPVLPAALRQESWTQFSSWPKVPTW